MLGYRILRDRITASLYKDCMQAVYICVGSSEVSAILCAVPEGTITFSIP